MKRAVVLLLVALAAACAPKTIPVPIVSAPKYPDFVAPAVPPTLVSAPEGIGQDRGWQFLQSGDLRNAEREFEAALKRLPTFGPAEAGLGYVELARKDAKAALPHFDRAIERDRGSAAALVGRGQALETLGRASDALAAFEAAVAADPSLAGVKRRIEVMRFRGLEANLGRARQASRAGRLDEAMAAYREALANSPDSAVLYRELGDVERRQGDAVHALEHFRRAADLDPSDAASLVAIGDLLDETGDAEGAEQAYVASLGVEPSAAVDEKLEALRGRMALARLPVEYRAIEQAPQVTRADLAALIGVRLAALLQGSRRNDAVLITDLRTTWAAPWIITVTRAGIMEPFANHTFQPRTIVRRVDLAPVVSRLLARIAQNQPNEAKAWTAARLKFSDLSSGHLAYVAASQAIAAGAMEPGPGGAFQPAKPVSGAEALAAIGRLEALAGAAPAVKGAAAR